MLKTRLIMYTSYLSLHQDDLKESRHYSTGSSLLRTMDTHIMESLSQNECLRDVSVSCN